MTAHHVDSYGAGMRYKILVKGRLEPRWTAWFDGLTLTAGAGGVTVIEGPVVDQAALYGLLQTLRDIGLPLLSVNPSDPQGSLS